MERINSDPRALIAQGKYAVARQWVGRERGAGEQAQVEGRVEGTRMLPAA
jgi:hypothetical protein